VAPARAGHGDAESPQLGSIFERALGRHSVWVAWAAGAIYSLPGAEYLAGLVLLAKLGAPTASEVLAVLGFNLIMFAVIELPLLGFVLAPERTRSLIEKLNRWMTDHRRILIVIVTGAAGIYLLVSGFGDLG
jgi:Sap, sulfolipid-1-addressing protein